MRSYTARVDVIRNGATLTALSIEEPPQVTMSSEAAIKISMSCTFLKNELVDWLTDELKVWQVIDGQDHAVGVFVPGTVLDVVSEEGLSAVQVEAYDRAYSVQQLRTETIIHLSAGTPYLDVIQQFLTEAGIALVMATPSTSVLATDREDWDIGTDYLSIVNTLLAEINYNGLWFNADGVAILDPYTAPSAERIDHTYSGVEGGVQNVMKRAATSEMDLYNKPNVFIVRCQNPDLDTPLISVAENNNPLSELSIFKRRKRIAQVYDVDNIADQLTLDAYAQRIANESVMSSNVVTISTINMPDHGVLDVLAIQHPEIEGIFEETGWSMVLQAGQLMTHTIRRQIIV